MNKTYHCDKEGISLGEGPTVSWEDLADALASAGNPMSSGAAIRADLIAAMESGEVTGEMDRLKAVLAETAPTLLSAPDFTNEEIAAVVGD